MALIAPHVGENVLLGRMLNGISTDKVFLFKDTVTIDDDTVLVDLGEIPAGSGAPGPTTLSSAWTISTGLATYNGGTAVDFNFTLGAGWSVKGYGVKDVSDNLLWAENFSSGPFSIGTGGGTISVVLKITLD